MSRNIFVAVGGTGAKVADAFVRLLALGYPIVVDKLSDIEIWCLDPDTQAGAGQVLDNYVNSEQAGYKDLTGSGNGKANFHDGYWCPHEVRLKRFDPSKLSSEGESATALQEPTLQGILATNSDNVTSRRILSLFFKPEEVDIRLNRGFYQKPFIGSAIMAAYANSLQSPQSDAGKKLDFNTLKENDVHFFLCGSLYGGTGACGVAVLGKVLKGQEVKRWRIGGCLMAPYQLPPAPPRTADAGYTYQKGDEKRFLAQWTNEDFLRGLREEEQEEIIKQILTGFFAGSKNLAHRASQALIYYKDHAVQDFDRLYLIGKSEPDAAEGLVWSNGGSKQRNPPNSAEVIAALSAFHFFSSDTKAATNSYTLALTEDSARPHELKLSDLPRYSISRPANAPYESLTLDDAALLIDPERVLLATAATLLLIRTQLPWMEDPSLNDASKYEYELEVAKAYRKKQDQVAIDRDSMGKINSALFTSIRYLFGNSPEEARQRGWDPACFGQLKPFFAPTKDDLRTFEDRLAKKSDQPLMLGSSRIFVTADVFKKWGWGGGDYSLEKLLRYTWWKLYSSPDVKGH
jgi:hypothetical protein